MLTFSYITNYHRVGAVVLILHDIADCWMEVSERNYVISLKMKSGNCCTFVPGSIYTITDIYSILKNHYKSRVFVIPIFKLILNVYNSFCVASNFLRFKSGLLLFINKLSSI
ncbi:unnamed protein product [Schistosoma mattheei]|uniref:Uncharacterized protein n=1 Tax=Schistosoma mattheei TaxID=31246 RepID=A0A3P7YA38_9TREM|nr:unnamed protein product [Schistosoma mattheei]